MALTESEFKDRWSKLHGGADVEGVVGGWLSFSYQAARVCTALRITPNLLTLLGLLTAIAMALSTYAAIALLLLVVSLFFDGIDGSVAIFQHRESKFGATLDSVVDRISEALWFYALYAIGVPAWVPITLWSVAAFQEYARAKLVSLGVSDIGVVTPAERPVRASFLFIVLILECLKKPNWDFRRRVPFEQNSCWNLSQICANLFESSVEIW